MTFPARLVLSSDACQLLALLGEVETTTAMARHLGKHPSVVTRELAAVADAAPVVLKQQGRWRLTELGVRVSHWYREASLAQAKLLRAKAAVRIATTTQFAERVLAPKLRDCFDLDQVMVSVVAAPYADLEPALRSGAVDLAIACGRPVDPSVRFKLVVKEPFVIVAAPSLLRPMPTTVAALVRLPHVQVEAVHAGQMLGVASELAQVVCRFSEIGPARQACVAGLGWSVLPAYAVADELRRGHLRALPLATLPVEHFGAWWLRERADVKPLADRALAWLASVDLGEG